MLEYIACELSSLHPSAFWSRLRNSPKSLPKLRNMVLYRRTTVGFLGKALAHSSTVCIRPSHALQHSSFNASFC